MDILGIGPLELLLILIVALVVIGPRDMARTARTLGRMLNRLYKSEGWRTFVQASRNLRTLPNRLAREAELDELKQVGESLRETESTLRQEVRSLEAEIAPPPAAAPPDERLSAWTTPPTPAPAAADPDDGLSAWTTPPEAPAPAGRHVSPRRAPGESAKD